MSLTVIKNCKCDSRYQDKRYGKKRRVHNLNGNGQKATCTVCGDERGV